MAGTCFCGGDPWVVWLCLLIGWKQVFIIYSFVWQQKYTKNRALVADERILYCEKVCDLKL
jgi:hypothetical protein